MADDAGQWQAGAGPTPGGAPAGGAAGGGVACDVAGVLSGAGRLRVLCEVVLAPRNVTGLWTALRPPQPPVSHHLGLLLDAGLVQRSRAGSTSVYALGPLGRADGDFLIIRAGPLRVEWRVR